MICPYCKEEIQDSVIKCKHCGKILTGGIYSQIPYEKDEGANDYSFFSEYYQRIFSEFDRNGGRFMPKWNWAAFIFGVLWYLFKGMWVKGLIMIAASFIFAGIPTIFLWLYCGICGNYDHYLFVVKGKQLW